MMKKQLLMISLIVCLVFPPVIVAADETVYPDLLADQFVEFEDISVGEATISDPLEPINRVFFEFNDRLYFHLIKPVKSGYSYVIPIDFRECFSNFFDNVRAPVRIVNNLLQGRFGDAGVAFSRFLVNSTAGILGFADVAATEYDLKPKPADFGQTLGYYGAGEGVYLVWPVLGPSHVRSSFGFLGDVLATPTTYMDMTNTERGVYFGTRNINTLSLQPDTYEDLKKFSLDPYVAVRQSFFDFRKNVVNRARITGSEQMR